MNPIFRKEIATFLRSPAYAIIAAVFIATLNFLFLRTFLLEGIMNFRGYTSLALWLLLFIPAIGMRSMSEEMKSGTIELLLTKPLSITTIILGKYSALLAYDGIFLISMVILFASLTMLGNFPGGIFVAQFLGAIGMTAAMASLALYTSTITKNQIFAFLMAVGILFALIIIGTPFVTAAFPSMIGQIFRELSIATHIDNFAQGNIGLSSVWYFVVFIGLFLWLSKTTLMHFHEKGTLRLGKKNTLRCVILLVIGILIHAWCVWSSLSLDTTTERLNSLSPSTYSLLSDVKKTVTVTLHRSASLPVELDLIRTRFEDITKKFAQRSGGNVVFETEIIDTQDGQKTAAEAGIEPVQMQSIKQDQIAVQNGFFWATIVSGDKTEVIPVISQEPNLEYSLIQKITKITRETTPEIIILASESFNTELVRALETFFRENFTVSTTTIKADSEGIAAKTWALYLVFEQSNFPEKVTASLINLTDTNDVIYFFENHTVNTQTMTATQATSTGAAKVLQKLGMSLETGTVGDADLANIILYETNGFQIPQKYPFFTRSRVLLDGQETAFNILFPTSITGAGESLINTSSKSFKHADLASTKLETLQVSKDALTPFSLGRRLNNGDNTTVVIPNIQAFMTTLGNQYLSENALFTSALIENITGDSRLSSIRNKTIQFERANTDRALVWIVKGLNIYTLPLTLLLSGIIIGIIRNRKSR